MRRKRKVLRSQGAEQLPTALGAETVFIPILQREGGKALGGCAPAQEPGWLSATQPDLTQTRPEPHYPPGTQSLPRTRLPSLNCRQEFLRASVPPDCGCLSHIHTHTHTHTHTLWDTVSPDCGCLSHTHTHTLGHSLFLQIVGVYHTHTHTLWDTVCFSRLWVSIAHTLWDTVCFSRLWVSIAHTLWDTVRFSRLWVSITHIHTHTLWDTVRTSVSPDCGCLSHTHTLWDTVWASVSPDCEYLSHTHGLPWVTACKICFISWDPTALKHLPLYSW